MTINIKFRSLSLFEKISHPRHLFVYFRLFKQTLQFLKQIYVNKCRSSIWCMDSNPRPSEHESPPRATASRSSFSFSLFLSSLSLSLLLYLSSFSLLLFAFHLYLLQLGDSNYINDFFLRRSFIKQFFLYRIIFFNHAHNKRYDLNSRTTEPSPWPNLFYRKRVLLP